MSENVIFRNPKETMSFDSRMINSKVRIVVLRIDRWEVQVELLPCKSKSVAKSLGLVVTVVVMFWYASRIHSGNRLQWLLNAGLNSPAPPWKIEPNIDMGFYMPSLSG